MKRTPLAAAFLAIFALIGCRQLVGLDDHPGVHDAGAEGAGIPGDAASMPGDAVAATSTFCATADAGFCDDFTSGAPAAGWAPSIDQIADAGAVGALVVSGDGVLHATGTAIATNAFHNARLVRDFATGAQHVTLSFSISVKTPSFAKEDDLVQLALLSVPGSFLYPAIGQHGLSFSYTTTGGAYVHHDSETFFGFDAWHRMRLVFDLAQHTVAADIDGVAALTAAPYEPSGNTGGYTVAIGLRMQGDSTAIEVLYDDVVVDLQ